MQIQYLTAFLILLFSLTSMQSDGEYIEITVTVQNIKRTRGSIRLGVYDSESSFPLKKRQFQSYVVEAKIEQATFVVKGLKKDQQYAFAVYHDLDDDDVFDLNFLGLPAEPYGFSNNYRPILAGPDFEDCLVDTNADNAITIVLLD